MKSESTRSFDSAIDEAARRLSSIESRGSMASRVVARLGRQRRWNWRVTLVVASAATAAIILAVRLVDRAVVVPPGPPPVATIAETPAAPATVPACPEPCRGAPAITSQPPAVTTTVRRSPGRAASRIERATAPVESAAEAAWRARAVQALPEPAPIEGQVSQPEPIDFPLLQLKPLETPPIQLARLDGGR